MTIEAKLELLTTLTQIPTAAGREQRVSAFIRDWAMTREDVELTEDACGNLVLALDARNRKERKRRTRDDFAHCERRPIFITAHMDHPAFVVERIATVGENTIEFSFRGGVMDVFFEHAPLTIHLEDRTTLKAAISKGCDPSNKTGAVGKSYLVECDGGPGDAAKVKLGDIATWRLPPAKIDAKGILHTHACDDLAAVAAALAAYDDLREMRAKGEKIEDVRLLFTRSEEIGFIGAIAACKLRTMPPGSRVIALENSRSFAADSPIGGGPIVRVGDRLSIFTPWLTAACCARAEQAFGGASMPRASEKLSAAAKRPWQRKLMAGGACEASVFCYAGYAATCICLPLGNYHNMTNLDALQAGTYDATQSGPPRCGPEFIHTQDYLGLVDLLVAIGTGLPSGEGKIFGEKLEVLFSDKKLVLGEETLAKLLTKSGDRTAGAGNGGGPDVASPAVTTDLAKRTEPAREGRTSRGGEGDRGRSGAGGSRTIAGSGRSAGAGGARSGGAPKRAAGSGGSAGSARPAESRGGTGGGG